MEDWLASFGPLIPFMQDPTVTEVMANGAGNVFVERQGRLEQVEAGFADDTALRDLMVAITGAVGRPLDAAHPCADARLPDGSRVNCVVAPVAVDGPMLTIRKFPSGRMSMRDLVRGEALDLTMAQFLRACVQARINLIVCGGTGSGKTTLLNALSEFIDPSERIVTIEDTTELQIDVPNLVRLESVAPTPNDPGVPIRSLVINALRMRPSRIFIGECRGAEAYDMLSAMNTGHEGSMSTVHANSARDCLDRLETMMLMASTSITALIARVKVASALQLIVHVARAPDGKRRIMQMIEVAGMNEDVTLTQQLFQWTEARGFQHKGLVPGFVSLFEPRGVAFPKNFFSAGYHPPPLTQPLVDE